MILNLTKKTKLEFEFQKLRFTFHFIPALSFYWTDIAIVGITSDNRMICIDFLFLVFSFSIILHYKS